MTDWKGAFAQLLMVTGASITALCAFELWGIEALGLGVGLMILMLGIRIFEGD